LAEIIVYRLKDGCVIPNRFPITPSTPQTRHSTQSPEHVSTLETHLYPYTKDIHLCIFIAATYRPKSRGFIKLVRSFDRILGTRIRHWQRTLTAYTPFCSFRTRQLETKGFIASTAYKHVRYLCTFRFSLSLARS
jgi:hypothetical protein